MIQETRNMKHEKGQVMLITVLALSGMLIGATTIAGLLMTYQIRNSGDITNSIKAIMAADAGIECGLYELSRDNFSDINSTNIICCGPGQKVGDVNGDGAIDIFDFTLVKRVIDGSQQAPSNLCCINLNGDNLVDDSDANLIFEAALNPDINNGTCGIDIDPCPVSVQSSNYCSSNLKFTNGASTTIEKKGLTIRSVGNSSRIYRALEMTLTEEK